MCEIKVAGDRFLGEFHEPICCKQTLHALKFLRIADAELVLSDVGARNEVGVSCGSTRAAAIFGAQGACNKAAGTLIPAASASM